ncbi:MAG: hypothetical protein JW819_04205 [Candidatus Krumholzibacteriota bacterium]|nr:hypothetical protein [Candidatus Krumholzibacteriota bacterium]
MTDRRRGILFWALALAITLASAVYQRWTGPTYPVNLARSWRGAALSACLATTHSGPGDQAVRVSGVPADAEGVLVWRRYPTSEAWRRQALAREGADLVGALPHQPPAGKVEYWLELAAPGDSLRLPTTGRIVTRFKGAVPGWALLPHVVFIFLGMLVSNRAGLEALARGRRLAAYAVASFALVALGGMIFGPIVQQYAFGAPWTGVPIGWDLTDNKTLIAFVAWLLALVRLRARGARAWVLAAALVTLVIFAIPHSLLGSELRYE